MKLNRLAATLLAATAIVALAGCGGGSGGGAGDPSGNVPDPPAPVPPPPPPPPPTGMNFTVFTRDLLVATTTSETSDPVELETIEWVFTDDDNAAAYDDILAATEQ